MNYYLIASSVMFLVLGIIWHKKDWTNALIKMGMIGLGLWGAFNALTALGYIVKASYGC